MVSHSRQSTQWGNRIEKLYNLGENLFVQSLKFSET
jgi:hypothetical protein